MQILHFADYRRLCARAVFLALLLGTCPASAGEVAGDGSPSETVLQDRRLLLNGSATRTVWGFKVYEIGLFLNERSSDGDFIIGVDRAPKRVRISMLREVSEEQFASTVQESIDRNFTREEKQKFAGELERFLSAFRNGVDLKKGSVVTIDYLPGTGMVMGRDDAVLGTIPGDDFYHAILRLWLGKPLQESIRDGLLGKTNGRS